jgi:hypothetical protein
VADPGRDDDDIARADGFDDSVFASQLHFGRTAENEQGFMRRAVIMMIGEEAVPPIIAPLVRVDQRFDGRSRIVLG